MNATTLTDIHRPHATIPAGTTGKVALTLNEIISYDPPLTVVAYHVVNFPGVVGDVAVRDDQVRLTSRKENHESSSQSLISAR